MDAIEKYIRAHRRELDVAQPRPELWQGIARRVQGARRRARLRRLVLRASGVAAVLLLGVFIGALWFRPLPTEEPTALLSPEYLEAERFFQQELNEKLAQLAKYPVEPVVQEDLHQIDQVLAELREELRNVPPGNEEAIVQAMMRSYQTKLEILERILEKIQTATPPAVVGGEDAERKKSKGNEISI